MAEKKIPMRQCLGCREMKPKKELIRVVKTPEDTVMLDFSGKANGRGAYVCRSSTCLKKAVKAKAFERAFSMSVPEEVWTRLEKEIDTYG